MALAEYAPPEDEDEPGKGEALSDDELQTIVSTEVDNALQFIESDIAPLRVKATEYERGMLFGDEEEGRSQFVSRDVHDTGNSILPSLLRIFFGPERVVEFVPGGKEDVEMAEQATDYINHIFMKDNPGFLILHSAFKDALFRKVGIVKYWWDNSVEVVVSHYTGLDIMELLKLEADLREQGAEVEVINGEMKPDGTADVSLKVKRPRDRARIMAVPLEEWFINADARGLEPYEFRITGHGRNLPVSDLVAMGYNEDELDDCRGRDERVSQSLEEVSREPNGALNGIIPEPADESQEPIFYVEAFMYVDIDGDGLAELWKFCCAGPEHKILHKEMVDSHPFAEFPCHPEPHTFFGSSVADDTMDIQRFKSRVFRDAADSLSLSIFPRTAVTPGANMADVMNTEIGAVIRMERQGDVEVLSTPSVIGDAFPMLAYMDEVRESRTGMSKVGQGLDPSALQNTTALAANAQFSKSHEHIEIIARVIAETGMKRLFRGLLRLVTQNQRKARMVDLRGKFVQVDPRAYKADMEVTTNVALGGGTDREKIGALLQIKATQEQIILTAGPDNPLVSVKEYHTTLSKLTALAGFKNPDAFFKDPSQQPPVVQAPPPPSPEQMKQENEAKKIALQQVMHQNDMAQKNADRQQESLLKIYDINVRNKTQLTVAEMRAQAEAMRVVADLHIQKMESAHEHSVIAHQAKVAPKPASPNA